MGTPSLVMSAVSSTIKEELEEARRRQSLYEMDSFYSEEDVSNIQGAIVENVAQALLARHREQKGRESEEEHINIGVTVPLPPMLSNSSELLFESPPTKHSYVKSLKGIRWRYTYPKGVDAILGASCTANAVRLLENAGFVDVKTTGATVKFANGDLQRDLSLKINTKTWFLIRAVLVMYLALCVLFAALAVAMFAQAAAAIPAMMLLSIVPIYWCIECSEEHAIHLLAKELINAPMDTSSYDLICKLYLQVSSEDLQRFREQYERELEMARAADPLDVVCSEQVEREWQAMLAASSEQSCLSSVHRNVEVVHG